MAILSFSGEIYNEITGYSMDLEFDYEVYEDAEMTREEMVQIGENLASAADFEVFQYILDNLSIMLNLENVEMDSEDDE